jgi:membrane-bound metal-dependent hydrolase YbcI (DUF457 family)
MFLAAAPDLDYVYFPIHRGPTHSLSAVILVTLTAAMVTRWKSGRVNWRVAGICGLAWLSHIVIDWLGQDLSLAPGLQVLWPWNDTLFLSGWDVFRRTERHDPLSFATMAHNAVTLAQELAILGPVLLVVWWRRRGR